MKDRLKKYKLKLPKELKEVLDSNQRNWYMFKMLTEAQKQECVAFIMAGTTSVKRFCRAKRVMAIISGQDYNLKFYPC